jgi:alpha-galactosidase
MTLVFQPGDQPFHLQADRIEKTNEGLILHGGQAVVNMPVRPKAFYRHGWQSWSLATWHVPDFPLPALRPSILHPLQTDPVYVKQLAPNGSWLGAVEFENGKILLLGALGLESHVALHDQQLHGWYEAGGGDWFLGYGDETAVFARYTRLLQERLGKAPGKPAPRVWCSWYSLYTAIDEILLERISAGLGDLPFDVFQVDDGWQRAIGDWEVNEKFSSGMQALAAKVRASGRILGLWLAPLLVVPSSDLFRQHQNWLLHDDEGKLVPAGFNWGEPLYALDTTHPAVLKWLKALMQKVRAWGFDYLKLDFLYAGALPGKRHVDMPREAACRQGVQALREGMGEDAYFLACGAPILPVLGLCDSLRIGPDVAGEWESHRNAVLLANPTVPGARNAIRTTLNRLWLQPLVATDPDVVYFGTRYNKLRQEQKRLLQDLALICNYKATSDIPQWLNPDEREELRDFLEASPKAEQLSRYVFSIDGREVDFTSEILLPTPAGGVDIFGRLFMGWVSDQRWALRVFDWLKRRILRKRLKQLEE